MNAAPLSSERTAPAPVPDDDVVTHVYCPMCQGDAPDGHVVTMCHLVDQDVTADADKLFCPVCWYYVDRRRCPAGHTLAGTTKGDKS